MKRALFVGAVLGTLVALAIFVWGHVSKSGLPPVWVHYAWPTAILLMPFAGPLDLAKAAAGLISALLNGLLYALVFGAVALVIRKKPNGRTVA